MNHLLRPGLFAMLLLVTAPIGQLLAAPMDLQLATTDCLFVKYVVPEKGVVCSNMERARRLGKLLSNAREIVTPWGPFVIIGSYKGQEIFIAGASVGSGSGLLFSELFASGAKYIIRYGSDDVKEPPKSDYYLVKIIDEADGLIGFEVQSGIALEDAGKSIAASPIILQALADEAQEKGNLVTETRVCHHLENYHGLRASERFSESRQRNLNRILEQFAAHPKPASFDMETAVLFRIAKDSGGHAATVLQTVNKKPVDVTSVDQSSLELERTVFAPFVFDALVRIR
jgi:uridine phosphorylase